MKKTTCNSMFYMAILINCFILLNEQNNCSNNYEQSLLAILEWSEQSEGPRHEHDEETEGELLTDIKETEFEEKPRRRKKAINEIDTA